MCMYTLGTCERVLVRVNACVRMCVGGPVCGWACVNTVFDCRWPVAAVVCN